MNFDWYGASVDAGVDETAGEAVGAFPGSTLERSRARHGFAHGAQVKRDGAVCAEVMWGNLGRPLDDSCYVVGTGCHAIAVAGWLRLWKPVHRVSRVDVAEDYTGEGCWDRLSKVVLDVADEHGIAVEHAGDHHRAIAGRSLYLGGRSSVVREICYEKGIQIGGDRNHVRLELRVRPGSRDAKFKAASMGPTDLYGSSVWSRALAQRLGHPDIAKTSLGTVYREQDTNRAMNWMMKQYAPALLAKCQELGSWANLGNYIGEKIGDDMSREDA